MNLSIGTRLKKRCHPERSGGGKAGAAQSKDPALSRATSPSVGGILRLRSAPAFPRRNSAQDDTLFFDFALSLFLSAIQRKTPRGGTLRLSFALVFLLTTTAHAQRGEGFLQQIRPQQPGQPLSARDFAQHSDETPTWKNPPGFERDTFAFVRIRYHTHYGGYRGSRRWATDFPDADLNFSWRLQQMTSLKVDPDPKVLEITDPVLFRYPFIYIVEPGDLAFTDEEIPILRRYLLNGGFLMLDDFWGEDEWDNMAEQMKRVFPDRAFAELDRKKHAVFHNVFELPETLNLQCPNIRTGAMSEYTGVTWEREDAHEIHIRGITDDKGRLMVIACHNTDNGDGWEREGESKYYFKEFSEKKAYPLGINIIFYVMTH